MYLTDLIKSEISKGNYVGMLLLDVQKAFDCVNHEILLKKLKAIGIDPTWFTSYLSNRRQCVMINGIVVSVSNEITCGVPQGSLLAPSSTYVITTTWKQVYKASSYYMQTIVFSLYLTVILML